jgi:hypothetical protein
MYLYARSIDFTILIFDLELFQLCGFLLFFNLNFIVCSFETHSVVKDATEQCYYKERYYSEHYT